MNEIKVTVIYDKPTTSKFDALMAEYEAAKKYADETVAYYKPLADVAENAKFDAILEQLETIVDYAKRICAIHPNKRAVWIKTSNFTVCYRTDYRPEITWHGMEFTKEKMHRNPHRFCESIYNIIGHWDDWHMYEMLERDACRQLAEAIEEQTRRANHEQSRLYNITKGGN